MARLFNRVAQLTLAKPAGSGADGYFTQGANALVIRDLRVHFAIEKHLGREPNTCEVTVSNLREDSRAALQVKPLHVLLEAGHDGQAQRLFSGDVRWAQSRRESTDWETKINVADGDRAHKHARVNRSYRGGVDRATAITEAIKALGLDPPPGLFNEAALRAQFASGLSLHGRAASVLSELLEPVGYDWSIQDGRLQLLREADVRTDQAALISQETGLIGSPEFAAPTDPPKATTSTRTTTQAPTTARLGRGKPVLSLRTLIFPDLTPGQRIQVESRSANGLFKLLRVAHTGDTHGEPWFSDLEAVPV